MSDKDSKKQSAIRSWDKATQREWGEKILDGKVTFDEARQTLGVQHYQLQAWVGKAAMARAQQQRLQGRPIPSGAQVRDAMRHPASPGGFSAEQLMAFAEWYAQQKAAE